VVAHAEEDLRFYGRRLNCEDPILACHDGSLRTGAVAAGAGCFAKTKAGSASETAGPSAIQSGTETNAATYQSSGDQLQYHRARRPYQFQPAQQRSSVHSNGSCSL
jgi:hypothetical protein